MLNEIHIREIKKEEIEKILIIKDEVRFNTYSKFLANLTKEDILYKDSYNERKEKIWNKINHESTYIYIAVVLDEIAGYIKFSIKDSTAELQDLFVLDKFQGKGIESLLMNRMVEILEQKEEVFLIKIHVLKDNESALNFYKKHGFNIDQGRVFNYRIGSTKRAPTVIMYKVNGNIPNRFLQSARLILKSLIESNIPIIELDPSSNNYIASINGNYVYSKGILTPLNTLSAASLANDKLMSKKALKLFNIPTPSYLCYGKNALNKLEEIEKELENFINKHKRIIAKPQNGLKSKDVFLNITSTEEALNALKHILNKDYKGVLFEAFIQGDVHRLLFVKGQLIAALRREKGFIIADGVNTIETLIINKNKYLDHGGRNVGRIILGTKLEKTLSDQGYNTLSLIPDKGSKIHTEIDFSNLETVTEVTEYVNKDLARKLGDFALKVGLGLTGVDVISTDISNIENSSVIEINKEPSIDFHHYPDYGNPINVARLIADAIIEKYS